VAKPVFGALRIAAAVCALACSTACGSPKSDPAVWTVDPDHGLTPDSTTLTVRVTRTGCGEPQTGSVVPRIDMGTSTITITLRLKPHWSGDRTCPEDGSFVSYRVHLDEPMGTRDLVDGQCPPLGDADISVCPPDGVRVTWRHGQPVLPTR